MAKAPSFGCTACGATFARWAGRCTACGAMNSIAELNRQESAMLAGAAPKAQTPLVLERLDEAPAQWAARMLTGSAEFDRVLGGGLSAGSVILISGEPGIGKSTLLAQVAGRIAAAGAAVLYASAEESTQQVRERCRRLDITAASLALTVTSDADAIASRILAREFSLVVVDSIQLVATTAADGSPGSVSQVRASAALLVQAAKTSGTTVMIVGHVTKDGGVAGPRLLEHLVDTVLHFEGERYQDLRTLRALKNRFGDTQEIGLFAMTGRGLEDVQDPGGVFIAGRQAAVSGSCVLPALEGNRCLLVEVQALVNPTSYPQPQRRVSGLDPNRVAMVLAVLSRRLHLALANADVFVNVTGGARVQEPAADLAVALAVVSAARDLPVPGDLVVVGEVGLGGELRPAPRYDLRAAEARRLGFQRLIGPGKGQGRGRKVVAILADAIDEVFGS